MSQQTHGAWARTVVLASPDVEREQVESLAHETFARLVEREPQHGSDVASVRQIDTIRSGSIDGVELDDSGVVAHVFEAFVS